jgi:hypothetical protein
MNLTICDIIFCVLAKHISGDFSKFFERASFFPHKLPFAILSGQFGGDSCFKKEKRATERF